MGSVFSGLTKEDIGSIREAGCRFSDTEIKKLYSRFRDLDKDEIGRIYLEQLLCIPEISINPLGERVIRKICSVEGTLDFRGFLRVLGIFSNRSSNQEKSVFLAEIISAGAIERKDLEEIANDLYGGIYEQEKIVAAVDLVFKKYQKKPQESISPSEMKSLDCSCLSIIM
ncbi:serine/threonine-protein phosphatase 2B regulatory subunit [Nematocida homosporus]|uniref:serine/threonine-protein phosphatase 2B regulatory subunit n=1 Tax=Nematocida homosporus TaxID=1912981 RepID=UPI002220AF1D|nr:serine/threonine-protein phosphatase 2B regulatory subunit [Nematocida homosporus]KAI5184593.1 serine/threonine-protein phosphatase 2B regulatory subunit [Nematocida homosporus]